MATPRLVELPFGGKYRLPNVRHPFTQRAPANTVSVRSTLQVHGQTPDLVAKGVQEASGKALVKQTRALARTLEREAQRLAPKSHSPVTAGKMAAETRAILRNQQTIELFSPAPALWRIEGFADGGLRPFLIGKGSGFVPERHTVQIAERSEQAIAAAAGRDRQALLKQLDDLREEGRSMLRMHHNLSPREQAREAKAHKRAMLDLAAEAQDVQRQLHRGEAGPEELRVRAAIRQRFGAAPTRTATIPVRQYGEFKMGRATLLQLYEGKFRYPEGYNFLQAAVESPEVQAQLAKLPQEWAAALFSRRAL